MTKLNINHEDTEDKTYFRDLKVGNWFRIEKLNGEMRDGVYIKISNNNTARGNILNVETKERLHADSSRIVKLLEEVDINIK